MADTPPSPEIEARQRWMAVLARAGEAEMMECLEGMALPEAVALRGPEVGLVMVRGRIGGGGGPFNVGEMTVTRCTVKAGGQVGHATVAGRETGRALLAARIDAAMQDPAWHDRLEAAVITPLAAAQATAKARAAARAAATKVEFFTMQTMRT